MFSAFIWSSLLSWDEVLVCPVLPERDDPRKFINLELLVFGGMGIVEIPLLKWDVSADKVE